ncbi:hypothetical protein AB4298_00820 [Shewanella sp. 10N.261.52.F9]|uniref:hypothetical protein n=1 Tax=Shewanella sp. 10N.261.52.F9 TaxID=3229684 RepID=UPI003552D226
MKTIVSNNGGFFICALVIPTRRTFYEKDWGEQFNFYIKPFQSEVAFLYLRIGNTDPSDFL